ncbi:MAG: serine/threonine-protein kinase [Pirellulaceae bacterium]
MTGQNFDLDAPTVIGAEVCADWFPDIEGYQLLRELGRGGMGQVYLARHLKLNRLVALKTISGANRDLEEVLVAEAQIAAKLEHPAIVPVYEVQTSGSALFFSMGYVAGEDLARRVSRKVLSVDETVSLGLVLCEALQHAHDQGILHLDLKPANILLDGAENPKIADFGLSAFYDVQRGAQGLGTPQFMSPEQILNRGDSLTPAADIYSLGAVLYTVLAGRPPIIAADSETLLHRVIAQPPPSLREFGIRVPPELEAIILHCLHKQPQSRYQSAKDLQADLVALTRGEPVQARPPSFLSWIAYQTRRHLLAASVSGSAVLLLLLLISWVIVRFVAQSWELDQAREEASRLSRERLIWEQRIATSLTAKQNNELKFAVAKELAEYHAADGNPAVAAQYAAQALLTLPREQRSEPEQLVALVREALGDATAAAEAGGPEDLELERLATPDAIER